ncbi:dihydrofolate reductase family protein [Acerihabitans arboris]|uniref:Pyrimidine reductase n=1 Tax=Acerihabitans arboris TaxID=2691583 RepID=A0A845SKN9_9GAMM|nr:dihydrofolate reductase family protein [Acerihabitans arboris]NDL63807.1 pyrimidine reductase [Acerihabitans arboris]
MKPYIVCHMMSAVDGRSLTDGWNLDYAGELYETTAATFKADGWICGRVTMQEVSHGTDYPRGLASTPLPRTHYFARRDAGQYAIAIDPRGLVAWKSNTALDSHVIEVVTKQVSDDFLAYLRSIEVSYVFGGESEINLAAVVELLAAELGVKRLIVEGGAHVSGAFVNAGLVDEVSVLILPLVDGRPGHPSSFEIAREAWKTPNYLRLASVEKTDHDGVWLRYTKV